MTVLMKKLCVAAGFVLLFVGTPAVASAHNYYVSPEGNDANPGTEAEPWQTISKAANTIVAGDTVYIKQGVYKEVLKPKKSGEPDQYITYTAYPGHVVTLDGEQTSKGSFGGQIDIADRSYIQVSNLRVVNAGHFGIRVADSDHILLKENQTDFTYSSGIYVANSRHVIVDGNDVQRACHGIGGPPPHYAPQEHITIRGGTDTFEVKNNKVHNPHNGRGKEGIDIKEGASNGRVYNNQVHNMSRTGLYVDAFDAYVTNVEIFGNVVTGSLHGIVVASERRGTVSDISIYNNLFYNNQRSGIWITHYLDGGPMRNIKVLNNTIYNNAVRGIAVTNLEVENILIRNNIILQNATDQIFIEPGVPSLTVDHNFTSGVVGFLDQGAGDFRLSEGSPAIDGGASAEAPPFDFSGAVRPQGAGHDIGAFEFNGSTEFVQTQKLFLPDLHR